MLTPISTRANSDALGFSLLELTLVLLIVGVLLALAVPRLPEVGAVRADATAERLASLLRYLHDEAALRGRIYRLDVDVDVDAYRVLELHAATDGGEATLTESVDPYMAARSLPEGVDLTAVRSDGVHQPSGERSIYFLPEGRVGAVELFLRGDDGGELTIRLSGATGRVRVTETVVGS